MLKKLLADSLFFISYGMFRSTIQQKSFKKHKFVMKLFRFSADKGSRKALSVYGHLLHFRGERIEDRIQGGIYLQRAAEMGDSKAQYQMARIYEQGFEGYFMPNSDRVIENYRLAAKQQHPLAIKRLIQIYTTGELGLAADLVEAEKWQQQQANLPH